MHQCFKSEPRTLSSTWLALALAATATAAASAQAPGALASRIEFVSRTSASTPAPRPWEGVLVLDLEGLESAEAALELAESWQRRLAAGQPIECWLRGRSRDALLEAAGLLARGTAPACRRVLVPYR